MSLRSSNSVPSYATSLSTPTDSYHHHHFDDYHSAQYPKRSISHIVEKQKRNYSFCSINLPESVVEFEEDGNLTPQVCTLWYSAPEMLKLKDYSYAVDIWSYGCILMECSLGYPLFDGADVQSQIKKIEDFFQYDEELIKTVVKKTSMESLADKDSENEDDNKENYHNNQQHKRKDSLESQPPHSKRLKRNSTSSTHSTSSTTSSSSHYHHYHNPHDTSSLLSKVRPEDVRERTEDQQSALEKLLRKKSKIPVDYNFIRLIEKILQYTPMTRLYASVAISHGFFYKQPYPCTAREFIEKIKMSRR